jgi:hypothetical protein
VSSEAFFVDPRRLQAAPGVATLLAAFFRQDSLACMRQLLIVTLKTGAAEQLAHAAVEGARGEAEVETRLLKAANAGVDDVLAADGYLFAMPENLAPMAGLMKTSSIASTTPCRSHQRPPVRHHRGRHRWHRGRCQVQRIATGLWLRSGARW